MNLFKYLQWQYTIYTVYLEVLRNKKFVAQSCQKILILLQATLSFEKRARRSSGLVPLWWKARPWLSDFSAKFSRRAGGIDVAHHSVETYE